MKVLVEVVAASSFPQEMAAISETIISDTSIIFFINSPLMKFTSGITLKNIKSNFVDICWEIKTLTIWGTYRELFFIPKEILRILWPEKLGSSLIKVYSPR